ncbi:hypothetical protein AOQ84DRAFT_407403 [Glonium stellatum]|uniref:Rhodopsin domain-containing protein n=1 Tax=Glonium stellatum TaxID=574774 RepID=A0A8E2FD40_9PEZI|nr:hypothetical protein AOQ84DRAFT_407403 [Glonium stellatum]
MADQDQLPVTERAHYVANIFIAVTTPLLLLSLILLSIRISTKLRLVCQIGWDDWLIVAGSILASIDWALLVASTFWFIGPNHHYITPSRGLQSGMLGFIAVPIWAFALSCIKLSVALTLLRFLQATGWRVLLYIIIGVQIFFAIANTIFALLLCRPIAASWNPFIAGAKCLNHEALRVASTASSYIDIATDIILSLIPLVFLTKLHRPFQEKILVFSLMAMGLFASIASIRKVIIIKQWGTGDTWSMAISMSTWTCIEEFFGILAACFPCLKMPLQRALAKIGVTLNVNRSFRYLNSFFENPPHTDVHLEPHQDKDETKNEENISAVRQINIHV